MISSFSQFILNLFSNMGYFGIFVLMTIESSFIPFPSEIVIPPAAYLASKGEMNLFYIIIWGTVGSQFGALINYYLAFFLGRKIIYKLSENRFINMCGINKEKIEKSEFFFNKFGILSTLIGRLIPVIRQLISIPAGIAKMNIFNFLFFTTIGAGIWVTILAYLGFYFGEKQDLIIKYSKEIGFLILLLAIFLIIIYLIKNKKNVNK